MQDFLVVINDEGSPWSWPTLYGNEQVSASPYENGQKRDSRRLYPIDFAGRKSGIAIALGSG